MTDLLQRLHAEIKRATPISEWFYPMPIKVELLREATAEIERLSQRVNSPCCKVDCPRQ